MININITTQVPEFFKRIHPMKQLSFSEMLYSYFDESENNEYMSLLNSISEHYNEYGYIGYKLPIYKKFIFIGENRLYDITESRLIINPNSEISPQETEIDLFDGYIYTGELRASRTQYLNNETIELLLEELGYLKIFKKLKKLNIQNLFVIETNKLSDEYELEIYDKWIIHNMNLINNH